MRLAVTGLHGQVVQSLTERGPRRGHEIIALGRPGLDLAVPESILPALSLTGADAVISAAAYTAVDKAEVDAEAAFAVNATGAAALAEAARALNVPFIHLSTDYVFDGSKTLPYVETDPTAPLGVYGASKLAGERAILDTYAANSIILRTAWVFSPFAANFVKTMLRLASERDSLAVVADQFGNPTSALDIADGVISVAERSAADNDSGLRGIFHMTAMGETSWASFAEHVFAVSNRLGGPNAVVNPIPAVEYPTPAQRPANSRLDCGKLADTYGLRLPTWELATEQVVARLLEAKFER